MCNEEVRKRVVYSLIFSPTGGTAKVTHCLTSSYEEVREYDFCVPEDELEYPDFTSFDIVFISVPSFRGRVPSLARERIKRYTGNGAKTVITAVYGNREYEDTLIELEDLAEEADFMVVAAVAAVAEHSELRALANGRPDRDDRTKLNSFSLMIKEKLRRNDYSKPDVPGSRPYKPDMADNIPPLPDGTCTKCIRCALSCPSGAIDRKNPASTDSTKCISCMKCISVCPSHSRRIPNETIEFLSSFLSGCFLQRKEPELFL